MKEYKHTLNLPKTAFPMKANLAQREPQWLSDWQTQNIYSEIRKARKGKTQFILPDGPPYANGKIHCGHALNKILKDIIIKSKTMDGFDAPYVPGWDCHGLPIELNVEKKVGKAGVKISPSEFRKKCREYAKGQIDIQREAFKRLGVLGDWDNPYTTMDFSYEANIIRALAKVVEKGHLQQGFKPVYWCLDCSSALAEAEVEYENKHSPSIDIRFRVSDETAFLERLNHNEKGTGEGIMSVPIWTTTPWTLPANQAVALNPNLEYVLVECEKEQHKERLLIAEELLSDVMQRYGYEHYHIVATGQGKALEGLQVSHPFYDREVPIVLGDHVTVDNGTGNVHTAPAHGQDDYIVGQKYQLPINNPVADNGCYYDDVELFANQHVLKVNDAVIDVLKTKGNLIHLQGLEHSYPHCWRHKTPVIFRATPQWFIMMDKQNLREDILKTIPDIEWIPSWGQERITAMVDNRPDWCVSRQRSWGTPITLFVHKKTRELHPQTLALLQQVAERIEKTGVDAWFDLQAEELLGDDAEHYEKVTDTLDVWFDSGVMHYSALMQRPELAFPADLFLEGSDQHRGWFNSSLTTSIAMTGRAPYKAVLTHGFTVDAKGHKMSKSRGNIIEPEKLIKTYGADILRLWVASADYRSELSISDEILKRVADTYRRIRNTSRFLLSNLFDFQPEQHQLIGNDLLAIDQWAVGQAIQLQNEIKKAYSDYQFHLIYQKIHHFCSIEMGSFYLDIIKDRQYTTQTDSRARRSCQTAMYHIVQVLVRCMTPILSFTAEEIWQNLMGKDHGSVFLTSWYEQFPEISNRELDDQYWAEIATIRDTINKLIESKRNAGDIGSALAAEVNLYCDKALKDKLLVLSDELRFVFITSSAKVYALEEKTIDAVNTEIEGLYLDIKPSCHEKCVRCWHRRADVGQAAEHPELCSRCIENIDGAGERRLFA